jgi:hypothetical protein
MKQISLAFIGLIAVAITLIPSADAEKNGINDRRLVEYWRTGDDNLSAQLEKEVVSALKHSPDFILSGGQKPGTLIIDVPHNVLIKPVGKRLKAFYTVRFSLVDGPDYDLFNHSTLSAIEGSCWKDDIKTCAAQILGAAKRAAKKIKNHD